MSPKLFPTILMVLDIAAAVVWAYNGDWRKAIYWICAGILTFVITY